jgi:hypothetical protein
MVFDVIKTNHSYKSVYPEIYRLIVWNYKVSVCMYACINLAGIRLIVTFEIKVVATNPAIICPNSL